MTLLERLSQRPGGEPLRALVVGLGSIGRRHVRNWAALGLGPVAVCRATDSPQPEPLGIDAPVFRSLDAALAQRPDLVIVTNPTSLHAATALAAIRAGCHVLVEKPIADSLERVPLLLAEAQRHGRLLAVGYNLRFHPGLRRLRHLLDAGAIGRPVSLRAEMGEYLPGWHPWEDYRQSYSARKDLGGGPVLTFSHEIDAVCWLLGAPESVTCFASRASSLELDTEDVAELVLRFPGGVLGSIHVDFVRRPPRRFVEITGEDGVLRWEYDENRLLVYAPATREWRVEQGDPRYERNDMFLDELRHLALCLRGEFERPLVDGRQGAGVLVVALAALRSSSQGRAVDLRSDIPREAAGWLNSLARPRRLAPTLPAASRLETSSDSTAALP